MKKRILVKQRDLSDCGAACLASVAAYFGLQIPVSRIRRYAGTGKQGTSLFGLIEAAGNLNFQARGAKATGIAPAAIPAPSIFHLVTENGIQHFVVVYKINSKRVSYMDPAWGRLITCPFPDFKKSWTGVVLLLMPSAQFQRGDEKKQNILRFWQLILPHRSMLLHAIVGAVVYTILGLSTSIYVEKIIDFVIPDGNKQLVNVLSILMIVLLVFRLIMGYFKSLLLLRTGQQIDSWLILGYYKHLLALPQRFFDSMRIGEIISRVNDAVRIRLFINDVALNIVLQTLTMVLALTVMFVYNWKLALILVASLPFYLLIYGISNKVNAKWQREIMEKGAVLESQLVETIQGVGTIRRFGSEAWFILKTEHRFISMMRTLFTSSRNGLLIAHATEGIGSLLTICILWTGSFLVIDRFLSAGELLSFYTLAAFFTNPVLSLISANGAMQDALIAADRLFEIIDMETEMDIFPVKGLERLPAGDLIFKNAYFSYGCGNSVFSGLHLQIPRNQITAILGESGCGKSTLLSLIQRLYPLNAGNILIGETDIRDIAIDVLRDKMAAVPQHTDLFQTDIISNITLGDPTPDLERIFNICHRLGLHEFISQLPARYQTIIREQGINLSVGQKQRIGIARALYKDPSILILDEATSALDPETERKVQETIRWFSGQERTVVIISHRLATIKYCEFIIFLKQGTDACSGTHQWLLSENRDYARWWEQHY